MEIYISKTNTLKTPHWLECGAGCNLNKSCFSTLSPETGHLISLRIWRTFITLSAERGMPDHIIMRITGIRDPKTLLKYKKTAQKSVVESMHKYWG